MYKQGVNGLSAVDGTNLLSLHAVASWLFWIMFVFWPKVFSASNVQLVTKTRTEHLTEQDKKRTKKVNRTPLESFLGVAEEEEKLTGATANGVSLASYCLFSVTVFIVEFLSALCMAKQGLCHECVCSSVCLSQCLFMTTYSALWWNGASWSKHVWRN